MKSLFGFFVISLLLHAMFLLVRGSRDLVVDKSIHTRKVHFFIAPKGVVRELVDDTKYISKNKSVKRGRKQHQQSKPALEKLPTNAGTLSTIKNGLTVLDIPLVYPSEAVKMKMNGVVVVEVSFSPLGVLINKKIVQSSGHQLLDRVVLDAIDRSSLKQGFRGDSNKLTLSFEFKL